MMAIFTADYVVRRAKEVRTHWKGLLRLSGVMAITVGLIIAEPDLGATVVIVMMMVGVFFLAGAPPTQFLIIFSLNQRIDAGNKLLTTVIITFKHIKTCTCG